VLRVRDCQANAIGSPRNPLKRPLDEPSPISLSSVPRTRLANDIPSDKNPFIPSVASTSSVLGEKLKALRENGFPNFPQDEHEQVEAANASLHHVLGQPSGTSVDIENFQKDLSGESQTKRNGWDEPDRHVNGKDLDAAAPDEDHAKNKSVSFHPSTKVYEDFVSDKDKAECSLFDVIFGSNLPETTLLQLLNDSESHGGMEMQFCPQVPIEILNFPDKQNSKLRVGIGTTKTTDGDFALHRSLVSSTLVDQSAATISAAENDLFNNQSGFSIKSDFSNGTVPRSCLPTHL
jgi:hypothetical protein